MFICLCAAVSEAQVHACIAAGALTAEEIGDRCRAGIGCGGCRDHLDDLIDERSSGGRAAIG